MCLVNGTASSMEISFTNSVPLSSSGKTHSSSYSIKSLEIPCTVSAAFSRDLLERDRPAGWKWALHRGSGSAPVAPGLLPIRALYGAPCAPAGTSPPPDFPLAPLKSCSTGARDLNVGKLTKSDPFTSEARKTVNKSPDVCASVQGLLPPYG